MERLTPKAAAQFLADNHDTLFIDCRSKMEFVFVGHPKSSLHLAWREGPSMEINPQFVAEAKKLVCGMLNRPVLVICRSGARSMEAAQALEASGFTRVHDVIDGFEGDLDAQQHRSAVNGWRAAGLPWEQS